MSVYTLIQLLIPTGTPCLHAYFSRGVKLCIGIEVFLDRHNLSLAKLNTLFLNDMLPSGHGIHFIREDATKFKSYDPLTHIMSFDIGVPDLVMQGIALTLNASTTVQYYISWRKPADIQKLGFSLEFMGIRAPTPMHGSGSIYSGYFYKVPLRKQSRRQSKETELCTKHETLECRCNLIYHSSFALSDDNNPAYTLAEYTKSLKKSNSKRSRTSRVLN